MAEPVSKLVIGTAQFGMPYGIANENGQVKKEEIATILDIAQENGIDTLDTAKAYGTSEEVDGSYLKNYSEYSWEIITKISDGKNQLSDQLQDSINKLTVRPTVLLAHSAGLYLDEAFQEDLQRIRQKKSVKKTGVSLYEEKEIDQVLESGFKPDIVQIPLNILDTRLFHRGTLRKLAEEGIEVHARSAFLQGLFYLPDSDLEIRFPDAVPCLKKLKFIAKRASLTLAELSLLWLVSLKEVGKVVIGVDSTSQLMVHLKSLEKNVDPGIIEEALYVRYENETVLNPSLWNES